MEADEIEALASSPAAASGDGNSMTARSASDIIQLLNYAAQKRAASRGHRGVQISKVVKGGTVAAGEGE